MKALSIKQPFAELIVAGKKTIELRSWNTQFRGEFLVHASGNIDAAARNHFKLSNLPRGAIIGKATLVDVIKYNDEESFWKDKDKHKATKVWGNYGFVLENPVRFEQPIPYKGKLNFWNYEGPLP